MKIGVITPTYNRPELLVRLHESLFKESEGVDWIHFAVDDGSNFSYVSAIERCVKLSNRFRYKKIFNQGALIARNHAIDMAFSENCTHLCFIDDDDLAVNFCLQVIRDRLLEFSGSHWFIFGSNPTISHRPEWPKSPMKARWFYDFVLKKSFPGDNLHVISADFVGDVRFSGRGRNQREWTFFIKLSGKDDAVMIMPELVMLIDYQLGGITDEARKVSKSSPQSLLNNVERAYCYWRRAPFSFALIRNLLKQTLSYPVKRIAYYFNKK